MNLIEEGARLVLATSAVLVIGLVAYVLVCYLRDRWLQFCEEVDELIVRVRQDRLHKRYFRTVKRRSEGREREVRNWVNVKLSGTEASSAVNPDIVAAQRDALRINRLIDEVVPNVIRGCVQTHRLHAEASGAVFIREIAWEEDCVEFRQHVVGVVEVAIEMLQAYPLRLDDHRIQHDAIVLKKRILPTCSNCPFLSHRVIGDPKVCSSAKIAGVTLTEPDHHDCNP